MYLTTAKFRKSLSHRALILLALLAYALTGATTPPGYMAAPLDSGTAFHLCPGDFGSSLIIDTRPIDQGAHHHHHAGHGADSPEKSSAQPGCTFSGYSSVAFIGADELPEFNDHKTPWLIRQGRQLPSPPPWLHRPARSPPAKIS